MHRKNVHLSKDAGQDKLAKGCEEEEAPVETKDVDHLGAKRAKFQHVFTNNHDSNEPSSDPSKNFEPASKSSPCWARTSQTGN